MNSTTTERGKRSALQTILVTEVAANFDRLAALRFRALFRQYLRDGRFCHIIDLRAVEPIQSTTLAGLIGSLRIVREVGGAIALVVEKPEARKVLTLTALDRIFPTFVTLEAAQDHMRLSCRSQLHA